MRNINTTSSLAAFANANSTRLASARNVHAAPNEIQRERFELISSDRGEETTVVALRERAESAVLATLSAGPGELDLRRRSLK